ncbi:glutathione S-transferase family protein [Pseudooceanicola sp. C21-150M6]|uniref:glutathione S-transferase family protein n=1 Tax=Pseudooceanicola sp. C21-150M6 TaxID=3434355 RepID=UPI003D7FFB26
MITLYWNPQSRAERMFWILEEIGQPYQLERMDFRADPPAFTEDFQRASPLRKVPALRDGEVFLSDSAAIALYLADRYSMGDLAPAPDAPDRGPYLYWMFFTPSALEPAMTERFADIPSMSEAYPWGTFERMVGAFESQLKGREWMASDRFTMADAMMASSIAYLARFGLYRPVPHVADYLERCAQRPAFASGQDRLDAENAALK